MNVATGSKCPGAGMNLARSASCQWGSGASIAKQATASLANYLLSQSHSCETNLYSSSVANET